MKLGTYLALALGIFSTGAAQASNEIPSFQGHLTMSGEQALPRALDLLYVSTNNSDIICHDCVHRSYQIYVSADGTFLVPAIKLDHHAFLRRNHHFYLTTPTASGPRHLYDCDVYDAKMQANCEATLSQELAELTVSDQ